MTDRISLLDGLPAPTLASSKPYLVELRTASRLLDMERPEPWSLTSRLGGGSSSRDCSQLYSLMLGANRTKKLSGMRTCPPSQRVKAPRMTTPVYRPAASPRERRLYEPESGIIAHHERPWFPHSCSSPAVSPITLRDRCWPPMADYW